MQNFYRALDQYPTSTSASLSSLRESSKILHPRRSRHQISPLTSNFICISRKFFLKSFPSQISLKNYKENLDISMFLDNSNEQHMKHQEFNSSSVSSQAPSTLLKGVLQAI